jgi:microcystin-dependent protein
MSQHLGEIRAFAGSDLPYGWEPCDGRSKAVGQNQALFALIGFEYGGNGTTTFALPDLRGRATAGTDESRKKPLASTSGITTEPLEGIPCAVVNWAIATVGTFPTHD